LWIEKENVAGLACCGKPRKLSLAAMLTILDDQGSARRLEPAVLAGPIPAGGTGPALLTGSARMLARPRKLEKTPSHPRERRCHESEGGSGVAARELLENEAHRECAPVVLQAVEARISERLDGFA
jgi:hypothetical protein